MTFITWDVQDVETGEKFPYVFRRGRVPREGREVRLKVGGQMRRVKRVFVGNQTGPQLHVFQYDGQLGIQFPTKRNAKQLGLPMAPGYDKKTGLPKFASRAAIDKYCKQLSKSKAYGKEIRWVNSE